MKLRNKNQMAVYVILIVMVTGIVVFRFRPLYAQRSRLEKKYAEQKRTIQNAVEQSEKLSDLSSLLKEMKEQSEDYDAQIPDAPKLGEFLHMIAELMNELELKEQMVQPAKESSAGELNSIPIKMQCSGTLEQFFEFYKGLENLDRFVRIKGVEIVNEGSLDGQVRMVTDGIIYYRHGDGGDSAANGKLNAKRQS